MTRKHSYEKIFRRLGFVNSRTDINAFYKSWNTKLELNENIESRKTHLQYGDIDWI
jgi:hypothetical protein